MGLRANALLLAATRAAVSVAIFACGFRAISDDDYARVVIAQRFAHDPAWDPSGTSWLPLPFWLTGGLMRVFGPELEVAQLTSFACGILASLLSFAAARVAGLSERGALLGSLLACSVPWFVWLGVSTTPEALAAALILFGIASSSSPTSSVRLLGGAALGLACWARYEAWPIAVVFAAIAAFDAYRRRSLGLAASALVCLLPACAWLIHGVVDHGDALFFVKRVVAYRRALGAETDSALARLFAYPMRLAASPELIVLFLLALASARRLRVSFADLTRNVKRPALLLGSLLAFLMLGELRDGTATHHAERSLLPIWLGLALITGELWLRIAERLRSRPRARS
ncbi:MAG TPA: glycosyltransferase family 39 protein, partial [Polyangiaceae bacterium]|nr:glycosyltransferase family 39 protein [Polyangiaceae bacterium]